MITQNEIISYVDKKGLEAIFKTNDFSHSLFFSDLDTNPKLSLALFINNKFAKYPIQWTPKLILSGQKLLLTSKRNKIK